MKAQSGFTLIELMIALALGLIISAAAIMLFLTSQKSYSLQQGAAELQDNANFGLNYITQDIRLTNLNTQVSQINDQTAQGGIVLTSSENATRAAVVPPATIGDLLSNISKSIVGTTAKEILLSRSNGQTTGAAPAWTGASNVQVSGSDINSDQLVIQYKPQYVRIDNNTTKTPNNPDDDDWYGGYDCEGQKIEFPVKTGTTDTPLRIIVQRYFLRQDSAKDPQEPNQALALACDSGWYNESGNPTKIENYGDAGEIIIRRVDHFRVLLGVQINATTLRYIPIKDYMELAAGSRPRILSVQLGLLARSSQAVGSDNLVKDDQTFQVLDQLVKVKTLATTGTKYVRQVVSQTVALRNTFGERGQ